jgi:hypothetical protein
MTTPPAGYEPGQYPPEPGYPHRGHHTPYRPPAYHAQPYEQAQYRHGRYEQAQYQQVSYPQPAYPPPGYPPPGYGAGPVGPLGPARPGMVTAGAVFSFVWGAGSILYGLIAGMWGAFATAVGAACSSDADVNCTGSATTVGAIGLIVALLLVVVAGLLIAGGVTALRGSNGKLSVVASGILLLLFLAWIIATGAFGLVTSVFGMIGAILIIVFLSNPGARAWIRAQGGKSF